MTVGLCLVVNVIDRDHAAGAGHVLDEHGGITGTGERSYGSVESAAGRKTDDDCCTLKKMFLGTAGPNRCKRSLLDKKGTV